MINLFQVATADSDTDPQNKAVNYTIQSGDSFHQFDIHPTDGYIVVRNKLDRETVSPTLKKSLNLTLF